MFLVSDTFINRQNRIRAFEGDDIFIGVLLATMDFEWTLRRAIIALGYQRNSIVRKQVLARCSGLDRYKEAWKQEVYPRQKAALPTVVPNWKFLKEQAFPLRHRLVHGVSGATGRAYAIDRRECLLDASEALVNFATKRGENLYARLPVRRKDLVLPS
jgi:hypothetical protein